MTLNKTTKEKKQTQKIAKIEGEKNQITKTVEQIKKEVGFHKDEVGEYKTNNGIIIPPEATTQWRKNKWFYSLDCTSSACKVTRHFDKIIEDVRIYTKELHGKEFKSLAEQFVNKYNK